MMQPHKWIKNVGATLPNCIYRGRTRNDDQDKHVYTTIEHTVATLHLGLYKLCILGTMH